MKCTKEQALDAIRKSDRERVSFCYYFYDRNWQGADAYDLTVNTAEINVSDQSEMFWKRSELKEVSPQSECRLRDNALKQYIRFMLLISENMEVPFLEIKCENGDVVIDGTVAAHGTTPPTDENA